MRSSESGTDGTDRSEAGATGTVHGAQPGVLGHPVDLVDLQADGVEERSTSGAIGAAPLASTLASPGPPPRAAWSAPAGRPARAAPQTGTERAPTLPRVGALLAHRHRQRSSRPRIPVAADTSARIAAAILLQMRGTAKNWVGRTSRMCSPSLSMLWAKYTTFPYTYDRNSLTLRSAMWAGAVAQRPVVLVGVEELPVDAVAAAQLAWVSITALGGPVVPLV